MNTSTTASRSPLASASTAMRDGGVAPVVKRYHTDGPASPQSDPGSDDSTVAPVVVPVTVAGSVPRFVAALRLSLGGGEVAPRTGELMASSTTATNRTVVATIGPVRRRDLLPTHDAMADSLFATDRRVGKSGGSPAGQPSMPTP